jgi:hypothetical protein
MTTEKRLAEKLVDYYNQTRTTQTPPDDWVLFKAARLCGWDTQIEGLRRLYGGDKTFRALCDMIQPHEALTAKNELWRKALEVIALGSIIELDDEDVPVQVWLDDEDMRSIARAALEKQP